MSVEEFTRTEMLLGKDMLAKLQGAQAAVFGVGGVGGYVCEALVRAGLGEITVVDGDTVDISNINRQIIALHSTIGKFKVDVIADRMMDINTNLVIHKHKFFFDDTTKDKVDFSQFDYVVDAIDTVRSKVTLVEESRLHKVPIICSMGTANKLDPMRFEITDISKTEYCPLARAMRHELSKKNISNVNVVYSRETRGISHERSHGSLGSISFVPSAVGMIIASHVVRDILQR